MKPDHVFATTTARASDFEFNDEVVSAFEDMLVRSIPYYVEQQYMIQELANKFLVAGSNVYDLGCSLGTTLIALADKSQERVNKMIGYDNSAPMIEQARQRVRERGMDHLIDIEYGDLNQDVKMENASVVIAGWTFQFVRPLHRDHLVSSIYEALVKGGALLVMEKVLVTGSVTNRVFIELYYDFKRRNQYSETEIMRKREALENVLVPYTAEENMELFRRNGFTHVETFFQWYNFAGFLCVKG